MAKTAFSDGNPLLGILGTIVNAAFLNNIFNHRHDGLDQDGSAPLDYAADTGAANAYAIALSPALTAQVEGLPLHFKAVNANTGASTLAVNGMAAKAIIMPDGSALTAGAIIAGQMITVIYTGTAFMLVSNTSHGFYPTGQCIFVPATAAPNGFIKMNGALLSRTTYAALYSYALASGNMAANDGAWEAGQFSPGDGATTFRIPDGRAEFFRGWDDARGIDTARTIGSAQTDLFKSHNHVQSPNPASTSSPGAVGFLQGASVSASLTYTLNTGGTETRPRNIALLACIKY